MRYGKVAILITIAAAALRCSGNPPVSEPGQAVLNAPSAVVINAIDHQETPAGTEVDGVEDRKSTRLNSSHLVISYAVFCLKNKQWSSRPEASAYAAVTQ